MSGADWVDPELRSAIRAARTKGIRCIKIVVKTKKKLDKEAKKQAEAGEAPAKKDQEQHDGSELCLNTAVPDDPKEKNLEKEFVRCASNTLEEKKPCLVLFRTDGEENIEGSRWLLLTWIPSGCTEAERAMYIRSRGLLTGLVQQPYFLQEVFARSKKDLAWANISQYAIQNQAVKPPAANEACSVSEHRASGPLIISGQVDNVLQRLVDRKDNCTVLTLLGAKTPVTWKGDAGQQMPSQLTLEAKTHECRGSNYLAKSVLPTSTSFFATMTGNILFFITWAPDSGSKRDESRKVEARYAVLRASVQAVVMKAFKGKEPSRVVPIMAREPGEMQDQINKVIDAAAADPAKDNPNASKTFPQAGTPADFPAEWPSSVLFTSMSASLSMPERLVPPWRGGSKAHSIGNNPDAVGSTTTTSSRARKSIRYANH